MDDLRKIQEKSFKRIKSLEDKRDYSGVVTETDKLLKIIGTPQSTKGKVSYSFENVSEFTQYICLHHDKGVEWSGNQTSLILMHKAIALYELGNYRDAKVCLQDAIKYNPINLQYKFELVENLLQLKEYEEAEKTLRILLSEVIYPADIAHVYRRLGYYYAEINKLDEAIATNIYSLNFAKSDKVPEELMYIQSLKTGLRDPEELAKLVFKDIDKEKVQALLAKNELLIVFDIDRKNYVINSSDERLTTILPFYRDEGIIPVI